MWDECRVFIVKPCGTFLTKFFALSSSFKSQCQQHSNRNVQIREEPDT